MPINLSKEALESEKNRLETLRKDIETDYNERTNIALKIYTEKQNALKKELTKLDAPKQKIIEAAKKRHFKKLQAQGKKQPAQMTPDQEEDFMQEAMKEFSLFDLFRLRKYGYSLSGDKTELKETLVSSRIRSLQAEIDKIQKENIDPLISEYVEKVLGDKNIEVINQKIEEVTIKLAAFELKQNPDQLLEMLNQLIKEIATTYAAQFPQLKQKFKKFRETLPLIADQTEKCNEIKEKLKAQIKENDYQMGIDLMAMQSLFYGLSIDPDSQDDYGKDATYPDSPLYWREQYKSLPQNPSIEKQISDLEKKILRRREIKQLFTEALDALTKLTSQEVQKEQQIEKSVDLTEQPSSPALNANMQVDSIEEYPLSFDGPSTGEDNALTNLTEQLASLSLASNTQEKQNDEECPAKKSDQLSVTPFYESMTVGSVRAEKFRLEQIASQQKEEALRHQAIFLTRNKLRKA